MATRRRIGVSIASTEAARRQLMQPVPCWEKVWVTPDAVSTGTSNLKVYKWIKTDKVQQFSDDEGEVDEPLAPLPDEPEVVEGDEEEQDEVRVEAVEAVAVKETDLDPNQDDLPSKVPSPKPELMMLGTTVADIPPTSIDELDQTLKPLEDNLDDGDINDKPTMEGLELDISGLGPDGLQLENTHDLSQLDGPDGLIGGSLMDESIDPFADPSA